MKEFELPDALALLIGEVQAIKAEVQDLRGEIADLKLQLDGDIPWKARGGLSGAIRADTRADRLGPSWPSSRFGGDTDSLKRHLTKEIRALWRKNTGARDLRPRVNLARLCKCGCGVNLDELKKNADAIYASSACSKRASARKVRETGE